ncbi:hypothetical protein GCM10010339_39880 [Streptomyces alanosinicus]|uniref:Uncharacterized protein n=1 Tax=Streptomyces alanosinicus TaxID=68171 RepID=A0A919D4P2_9ACTN|nr:hypothetical protein GCM10010339_39880 [Streptomyces alanosinicus]
MQQGGAHDPQRHPEPVAGEQPDPGVGGERERAGEQQQLEGAAEGHAARPPQNGTQRYTVRHHRSPKVSRATHLVLSTPGAAGTMIRAG